MDARKDNHKLGVWIVGALGDIAGTLRIGAYALQRGLVSTNGMMTQVPPLNGLELAAIDDLVFGGIDIRDGTLRESTDAIYHQSRTFNHELLQAVSTDLAAAEDDLLILPAMLWEPGAPAQNEPSLRALIDSVRTALREFAVRHGLTHTVVVNLASSEPLPADAEGHHSLNGFESLIDDDRKDRVVPSMCYAYAAFKEGCSHINFTPSVGASIAALQELAQQSKLPHYGNDGKTGETLVKTALAPMFVSRNLEILSWEAVNMLGNNDGKTLKDPHKAAGKLKSKGEVLPKLLGYSPHAEVSIKYVPSLGDWKTAWDLIHFRGFMDVPMTMQFIWQGCDSVLAAPLILDAVRMSEFAARHGEHGLMRHLACVFKSPLNVEEMALHPQFEMLLAYAHDHLQAAAGRRAAIISSA